MCSNTREQKASFSLRAEVILSSPTERLDFLTFLSNTEVSKPQISHERKFHQSRKLLQYFISRLFCRSVDRSVGRLVSQSVDIHGDHSPGTSKELYF